MAASTSSAPASASAEGPQLEFEGVHRTEGRFPVPDLEVDASEVDSRRSFFYQCWTPTEPSPASFASRPVVILVHGLGGHSGHLSVVAEYFSRQLGMRVYAYDTLGHGRSPGRRGHADSWTELRTVLAHFLRFVLLVCEIDPQRQLVLFGNSLGGVVCIEYMQRYADATTADEAAAANVCALVANAPGLSMQGVGWMAKGAVRLLSVLTPRYQIDVGLDSTRLTNDPLKQRENDLDPLVHSLATPALFNDWWEILHYVSNHADRIRVPFLMMQGAADKIVVPDENRHFFDKVVRTNDKAEFQLLQGGEHESFNDKNRSEVVAMYGDFLQRHHII